MARRETAAAAASHSRRRQLGPHRCRTAAAQLPQQAPCPRSRSAMRIGSPPTHEHLALRLALHLALHLAWAEGAQAPAPVRRQCMDAAQVSSPWRVPSCPRVRGTLSAVGVRSGWRGGKGGRCELRAISDLLLSHEQRPRPSVHAAQLPQRGLQLPKRHDQTATRGHEHVVSKPRPAAPPPLPDHRHRSLPTAPASAPAAHLGWWHAPSPRSSPTLASASASASALALALALTSRPWLVARVVAVQQARHVEEAAVQPHRLTDEHLCR